MPNWEPVYIVTALLAIALVFGVGEVLTPFFGLAVVSLACVAGALWVGFSSSASLGWATAGVVALGTPVFLVLVFRWLPRTSIGRSLMPPAPDAGLGDAFADLRYLESLRGRRGTSVTVLRPVGACEFEGRRVECQAEGSFIDKGTAVTVVLVAGSRVVVRPV
jgi:membrane-bound serine protease (ClpP class)